MLASIAMAQPSIDRVQNNYSYLLPAQPNYGIAPGSIFIVAGTDLANTTTALQNVPLQYSLDGVSSAITVNGTTTQMIMYYVTPGQIGGILPSTTPVGDGTITVTNNGQTSAPFPIKVLASAFGTLTLDGSGSGLAAVFDPANDFLGNSNPTQIGETIYFYGSGLGATPSLDETNQLTPTDLSGSLDISVKIGGNARADPVRRPVHLSGSRSGECDGCLWDSQRMQRVDGGEHQRCCQQFLHDPGGRSRRFHLRCAFFKFRDLPAGDRRVDLEWSVPSGRGLANPGNQLRGVPGFSGQYAAADYTQRCRFGNL